jgi:predicted MFS family arabinose efflux permease
VSLSVVISGFVYVWKTRLVLGTMSIDLFAVLFGGIMGMLPIFAIDILKIGPEGLGLLRTMPAVGGVLTGILLTQLPPINNAGKNLLISMTIFGIATTIFAISSILWLSLLMLFIYGAADMVSVYIRQTIIPIITPDNMRGRVGSVHSIATNSSNEIGDLRAGITASFIGIIPSVFIGGMMTIGVSLLWSIIFPELKKVKKMENL